MEHKICNTCVHMKNTHCVCGGEWLPITDWRKVDHCEFDNSYEEDADLEQANQVD